jgi:cytochrome c peroxidase
MKKKLIQMTGSCILSLLIFSYCQKEPQRTATSSGNAQVEYKPVLTENPPNYPASANDNLAMLGRVLFYDKQLSANNNIACATCHQQQHAFCDNRQFSMGTTNLTTTRNSPTIFNRGGRLFWDGRANSFSDLSLRPVRNPVEMNVQDPKALADRLSAIDYYKQLIPKAFPGRTVLDSNLMKTALAEFLKNFNFSDNKFNRAQQGLESLTQAEQTGSNVFFGKANCFQCHHVIKDSMPGPGTGSGYGAVDFSHNIGLDENYADAGVANVSHLSSDVGAFMMPVLLNIEFTGPYMHDGRFKTLEEVVEHYNSGIKAHPNLDRFLRQNFSPGGLPVKMNLTQTEKDGLVAFLKTFSDHSIFTDSKFSDPFVAIK